MSKKIKKTQGFTLIELLITIAIVGILASVVLVSLSNAKTKTRDTSASSAVKSLASAIQTCLVSQTNLTNTVGGSGTAPIAGQSICGGSEVWPSLLSPWTVSNVFWDSTNGYYWLRASDGGSKVFICDYSTNTWTTDGIVGNYTYKCTKIGF